MVHPVDRLIRYTLGGGLPKLIFVVGVFAGLLALLYTPREEEPQIVVPMVDVMVAAPGLSAGQVERQVTIPLEKLLAQIPGVEHVYSSSGTGQAAVTLSFYVGEDREDSILNTYNKLYSNQDRLPPVVSRWMMRPVEVDDVPIIMLGLWSEDPGLYSDFELRRMAEEVSTFLQAIPSTSEVEVVGGRPRTVRILVDPESLGARSTTAQDIVQALAVSNVLQSAGDWTFANQSIELEAGDVLRDTAELDNLVVNVIDGVPIYLRDVARIEDGPDEADAYTWIGFAPDHPVGDIGTRPMVAVSVAKQPGTNAVGVARDVHGVMAELKQQLLPAEVHIEVLRDYGQTANEKVNNLTSSLGFAIITVVVFIGVFLGWRPALVVGLAVPICYGITLAMDMALGYTINRVTLFALILSLGLLVDDPITGVDNISRFMGRKDLSPADRVVAAMSEIRVPLIMSTITIIFAFLPLAGITGMMGPYMAPMAFNVPASVVTSTAVAFMVTPWLASRLLKEAPPAAETANDDGLYVRLMAPLLDNRSRAKLTLWVVLGLFMVTASLPLFRLVPLKLLPFDNKNEVQVLIDMPESASLEQTAALAREIAADVARVPEVRAIAAFIGQPSPIDFNGMVRRYYQRIGPHLGELRITLADKTERAHQSHGLVLRLRELLAPYSADGISVKVVEVPPGPPVLSTLVAEIYADTLTPYATQKQAARELMARLSREAHVVEIDSTLEAEQPRLRFVTDRQKAALSGISTDDIAQTLAMANDGYVAGYVQSPREASPLPIELRLDPQQRIADNDFERLLVRGRQGVAKSSTPQGLEIAPQPLAALGELGEFETGVADTMIHRKDLRPVVYVMAELNGRTPAEIIADVHADMGADPGAANDWQSRTFLTSGAGDGWQLPQGTDVQWTGEGEWRITKDVFRDMGLGYAFALLAIFFVLRVQTSSTPLSLIIMLSIPLTVIGIMPGFWVMNQFGERWIAGAPEPVLFTATAMIGMIALAGIVVRNSLILVEFISQARDRGASIRDALLQAGSVRMRPVLLTAGTTMLGNLIITLDPVFSGLALAIIFGIVASTAFSLVVVPVVYMLVFDKPGNAPEAAPSPVEETQS
ncbi:efflux RND transporter permease subunit [Pseudohalioglobus sediminis]|uniref:Efflux RND transporter permease subunit n=1 Tax=Pseudohalioglobus sediminis TaxID=2606449 RepID=A0A5B0X1M4_9GAMM|nr:efflux RND transporter permease subunit [Pseudohalioglobus sediminis]KAA1192019.1 efflux RND transporter permease subunit [Pseudohalioglobus sediminis]